jgi:hypothetical protein
MTVDSLEFVLKALVILTLLCVLFAAPMGSESAQQESESSRQEGATESVDPQEQLEELVPSEEISADHAISFPTDI